MEFKSYITCQNLHLLHRLNLLEISNLVYEGREIVRSLHSSLQGQIMAGIVS